MARITADRVLETSTTTGPGALTLAGAITGYRAFSTVCANADTAYYSIWGVDASGVPTGEWETGLGTWGTGSTFTRTTVHASTNAGVAVDFSAGTKRVALTATAAAFPAVLAATAGGTGRSGFAVGDLIYANTTTTLQTLADVATGSALISGGIGVIPSWGKIGLTTHVSGILPVANGGTNNAFFTISGPATSAKTFTFPNATATVLTSFSAVTLSQGGTGANLNGSIGILKSDGSTVATVTAPSGAIVGDTDAQTLTSKTLTSPAISSIVNTGTLTLPTSTDTLVGRATTDTLTNKTLTNPTVTNYVETVHVANTATAITLSLANGTVQIITSTGNATVTMPAAVTGKSFVMYRKSGTGGFAITWTTVKWPSATVPTLTSTASRMDIFSFFSDGTNWYGTTVGLNYTP